MSYTIVWKSDFPARSHSISVRKSDFLPEMAHTYLKCPKCKSPDFDIIAGRGVYIKNIIGDS